MSTVIKVENISKVYQLGKVGTGTLASDIQRTFARITGKEDPLLRVNETIDEKAIHVALRNVSFEVKQGEVLGVIGKNGAGKSTLLKILSRVTAPSTGSVKMKGRIASLLEVGTGFHPELSGRENIFLNGAILGMSRDEVRRKFDEIVDFSGVAKFIDTPVKRYSSGMYVRLAFAVAAHLEPEILIVDEVLAVGDSDFQKKCMGKMQDVSDKDGRTILFVSHNMAALSSLCHRAILLVNGNLDAQGPIDEMVKKYVHVNADNVLYREIESEKTQEPQRARLTKAWIESTDIEDKIITINNSFEVKFEAECFEDDLPLNFSMTVRSVLGQAIFNSTSDLYLAKKGKFSGSCKIPENLLNYGKFTINILLAKDKSTPLHLVREVLTFEIQDVRENETWFGDTSHQLIKPKLAWDISA